VNRRNVDFEVVFIAKRCSLLEIDFMPTAG